MYKIGTYNTDITPKGSVDLNGYILRFGKSTGVHDPLTANFFYLESEEKKLLLISLDILTISFETYKFLRDAISKVTNIEKDSIIIAAIHTHAAIGAPYLRNVGIEPEDWLEEFKDEIIEGSIIASMNTVECELYSYEAYSAVGINRRNQYRGNDPNAPFIVAENENGIIAMLINYNCHPVCLTESNLMISADYIHFLRNYIHNELEKNFPILFFNGGSGDIDPRHRGSFEEAQITGEQLAKELLLTYQTYKGNKINSIIKCNTINMTIPYSWYPTLDEATENFVKYSQKHADAKTIEEKKVAGAFFEWANEVLNKTKANTLPLSLNINITLLSIGQIKFIVIPLEIFSSISLKLRKLLGTSCFVISYGNGYAGYLCDKLSHFEGGYEIDDWHKYAGILPKVSNSEDIFWESIKQFTNNFEV